jgi:transcriptional regulator with XRE-family HTH domain
VTELDPAAISQRLALARKGAGIRQDEYAKALGVSRRTVTYWESPTDPRLPWLRLAEIAGLTGTTKEFLLLGRSEDPVDMEQLERIERMLERLVSRSGQDAHEE